MMEPEVKGVASREDVSRLLYAKAPTPPEGLRSVTGKPPGNGAANNGIQRTALRAADAER
jgi:hypothetical protein